MINRLIRIRIRRLLALVAACALALVAVPAAASACAYPDSKQVFSRFGDDNWYIPFPDGGFESVASGWGLTGGAKVVKGNETFYLGSSKDFRALTMPKAATATSPQTCIGNDTPSFRLVLKSSSTTARLKVQFMFPDSYGQIVTKDVALLSAGSKWAASPILSANIGRSDIYAQLRLTAVGGTFYVDDVYLDPKMRR